MGFEIESTALGGSPVCGASTGGIFLVDVEPNELQVSTNVAISCASATMCRIDKIRIVSL